MWKHFLKPDNDNFVESQIERQPIFFELSHDISAKLFINIQFQVKKFPYNDESKLNNDYIFRQCQICIDFICKNKLSGDNIIDYNNLDLYFNTIFCFSDNWILKSLIVFKFLSIDVFLENMEAWYRIKKNMIWNESVKRQLDFFYDILRYDLKNREKLLSWN